MAKSKTLMSIMTISTLTFLFSLVAAEDPPFHQYISPTSLNLQKEKLSHFHFYWHVIWSGPKPSALEVIKAQANSSSLFGRLVIADDPLTIGPDLGSKQVGKAQGMYGFSDQSEAGPTMIFNLVFTEREYNGTLTMVGRNLVFSEVREMPIVGGSGVFRFARGYARLTTYSLDEKTGNSVLEYNVYVFHY